MLWMSSKMAAGGLAGCANAMMTTSLSCFQVSDGAALSLSCLLSTSIMVNACHTADAEVEEEPYPVWVPPREPEFYRAR